MRPDARRTGFYPGCIYAERFGVSGEPRVLGVSQLDEREAFRNLIEALRLAESSARQLAYMRSEPRWLQIEFGLASTRDIVTALANAPR